MVRNLILIYHDYCFVCLRWPIDTGIPDAYPSNLNEESFAIAIFLTIFTAQPLGRVVDYRHNNSSRVGLKSAGVTMEKSPW